MTHWPTLTLRWWHKNEFPYTQPECKIWHWSMGCQKINRAVQTKSQDPVSLPRPWASRITTSVLEWGVKAINRNKNTNKISNVLIFGKTSKLIRIFFKSTAWKGGNSYFPFTFYKRSMLSFDINAGNLSIHTKKLKITPVSRI